jgi:nickel transport protein
MKLKSALALALASASIAQAHDIVLVPEANQLRVRYGHPQDWLSVDKSRLIELQVLRGDAAPADAQAALKTQGIDLVAPKAKLGGAQGAWLATARYDNGLWSELQPGADGKSEWRNASGLMVPNPKSTSLSVKFAKAYAGSAADTVAFRRRAGHLLEIVPQKNPLALRPGETLPVLVLFNGKPLPNAGIEVGDMVTKLDEDKIKRYTTGADGIAQLPLRAKGVHMFGVDVERPNDGSLGDAVKALPIDKVTMIATYTVVR